MNKKILAFFFLPIFLITLGLPAIKNSIKNNYLYEDEDFIITSSYFDRQTLDYAGEKYAKDNMTVLITSGIYNGDISQIDSITFSYNIKSIKDENYHNVSFNLDKNLFKIKQIEEENYFYAELPIYYDYSTSFIFLGSNNEDYFILNPTLTLNYIDGTYQTTTYEQDYEIEPGWTIIDNGDQSYPKIVGAEKYSQNRIRILYSDGDNFNFYDYSSFSVYHHAEYYDLYDTNNENLLIKDNSKLTPISSSDKINSGSGQGLYEQKFKLPDNEIKPPRNYGYKALNDSIIFTLNDNFKTSSYTMMSIDNEKEEFFIPYVYDKNIENVIVNDNNVVRNNSDYLKFDIYLNKIYRKNTNSYKEFTKHIAIGFNWYININVDDPFGGPYQKIDEEYMMFEAKEVPEINSSLLETPGLYYQESDILTINDNKLHYTYYLVLPDENDWTYGEYESYGGKMTFTPFNIYFPNNILYYPNFGYKYHFREGKPNLTLDFLLINK